MAKKRCFFPDVLEKGRAADDESGFASCWRELLENGGGCWLNLHPPLTPVKRYQLGRRGYHLIASHSMWL